MATTVLFNGVIYSIPLYGDVGYAQGAGNLSAYLIALAGGPFPFTSQSANPATAGTIRLAHSDTIDWRNFTNTGNLPLGVNASNQLTFNGGVIPSGVPLTVPQGGTGDTSLAAYSVLTGGTTSTNPVQTVSGTGLSGQALVSNGPAALPTWQTVAGTGTVNSGTIGRLSLYPASSNTVSDTYTQNTKSIHALIDPQGTRTVDLTYHLQNPGDAVTSTTLVMTDGDQVIGGSKTFTDVNGTSSGLTVSGGTLRIDAATGGFQIGTSSGAATASIASGVSTGPHVYTIPDIGTDATFAVLEGTQTFTGAKTLGAVTGNPIHGTNTNDDAAAGYIGEYASVNNPTGGTATPGASDAFINIASMSLPAGDWDVFATARFDTGGTWVGTRYDIGISLNSAAPDSTSNGGYIRQAYTIPASSINLFNTGARRISLSGTTTIYLVGSLTYSTLGATTWGSNSILMARRVR